MNITAFSGNLNPFTAKREEIKKLQMEWCHAILFNYQKAYQTNINLGEWKIIQKNDRIEEGCFDKAGLEGYGKVSLQSNIQYQGIFHNGKLKGPGIGVQKGAIYVGRFIDNKFNGKGIFDEEGNCIYYGSFKKGKMDGKGIILKYGEDYLYQGDFCNDHQTGQGFLCIHNESYEGGFLKGKYHGWGCRTLEEHSLTYSGYFIKGSLKSIGAYQEYERNKKIYNNIKTSYLSQDYILPPQCKKVIKAILLFSSDSDSCRHVVKLALSNQISHNKKSVKKISSHKCIENLCQQTLKAALLHNCPEQSLCYMIISKIFDSIMERD